MRKSIIRLRPILLIGSIQFIHAAIPHLRQQDGGRIVQVSSEGGQIAYPTFSLYHATKWGVEGFIESVAQEVAPFGIDFIIVEPCPTATNFGAGLVRASPMDIYNDTPVGAVRRAIAEGSFVVKGDAGRTVDAMISAADGAKPALRLALGSTAYDSSRTPSPSGSLQLKRSEMSRSRPIGTAARHIFPLLVVTV
jgi:NAD(P)-dependent dehydrogenase (short-subunit alcohol dehydrogenase family)